MKKINKMNLECKIYVKMIKLESSWYITSYITKSRIHYKFIKVVVVVVEVVVI